MSIKCNTIENTLLHGEQIGAAGAHSWQISAHLHMLCLTEGSQAVSQKKILLHKFF